MPSRERRSPDRHRGRNWVCLTPYAGAPAPLVICPAPAPWGPCRQIGFVLPGPIECTIHHNSFSAKPLPFFLPRRELGLFGAFAPRPPVPQIPSRPAQPELGLFRIIGSSWVGRPARLLPGADWLCFARILYRDTGGVQPQPKPVVHRFRRLAQIWEERAKGEERDDGPPWVSFLLLESAKICVIGGFSNSFRLGDLQHVSSFRLQIMNHNS